LRHEIAEDRTGWREVQALFHACAAKAKRTLAALETATAIVRIVNRLDAVAAELAVLAA